MRSKIDGSDPRMMSNSDPSQSSFKKSQRSILYRSKNVFRQIASTVSCFLSCSSWDVVFSEKETGSLVRSSIAGPFRPAHAKFKGTIFPTPDTLETSRAKFADAGSRENTWRAVRDAKTENTPTFAPTSTTTAPFGIEKCLVYAE